MIKKLWNILTDIRVILIMISIIFFYIFLSEIKVLKASNIVYNTKKSLSLIDLTNYNNKNDYYKLIGVIDDINELLRLNIKRIDRNNEMIEKNIIVLNEVKSILKKYEVKK